MSNEHSRIVEIRNVTAGYGRDVVLKNVSLDIYDDDFIGIIGPNGGGKTTFLKLLIGQVKPLREVSTYSGKQHPIGYCTAGMLDKNFSHNVIR